MQYRAFALSALFMIQLGPQGPIIGSEIEVG